MNANGFKDILYQPDEATGIAVITINRPERKNAMSFGTFMELLMAADLVRDDETVSAVIITGAPNPENNDPAKEAFSSGGYFNPKEGALGGEDGSAPEDERYRIDLTDIAQKRLTLAMLELEKPVITAMNGYGIGAGFTMPLACADLIFASEYAWAQLPFVRLGIAPEFASSFLLPRRIGMQKAKEIIYFGKKLSAQDLFDLGLVNAVVPHGNLLDFSRQKAMELVPPRGAAMAMGLTKRAIHQPLIEILSKTLDLENAALNKTIKSFDFSEGLRARMEKRKPCYQGR